MIGSLLATATLMLAAGDPSLGASSTAHAGASASSTEAVEAREKPMCRAVKSTGTRLPKRRICMSREEWKAHDEQSDGATRGLRGGGGGSSRN